MKIHRPQVVIIALGMSPYSYSGLAHNEPQYVRFCHAKNHQQNILKIVNALLPGAIISFSSGESVVLSKQQVASTTFGVPEYKKIRENPRLTLAYSYKNFTDVCAIAVNENAVNTLPVDAIIAAGECANYLKIPTVVSASRKRIISLMIAGEEILEKIPQLAQSAFEDVYHFLTLTSKKIDNYLKAIRSVAFSPNGIHCAASTGDGETTVLNLNNQIRVRTFNNNADPLIFSQNGRYIATRPCNKTIDIGSIQNSADAKTSIEESSCLAVFSPCENYIAAGFNDRVELYDASTKQQIRSLHGLEKPAAAVAFSPCGNYIAATLQNNAVMLWNSCTGAFLRKFGRHNDSIISTIFSPDSTYIATISHDKTAKIWESHTGKLLHTLNSYGQKFCLAAFSPDSTAIITASYDGTTNIWDITTGMALHTLAINRKELHSVALHPNGKYIATASSDGVAMWDIQTNTLIRTLSTEETSAIAFSCDGKSLLTGSPNGSICLWSIPAKNSSGKSPISKNEESGPAPISTGAPKPLPSFCLHPTLIGTTSLGIKHCAILPYHRENSASK